MNPNEIKKALKCCTCPVYDCDSCPLYGKLKDDCVCGNHLMKHALAYINQLEAEIERLTTSYPKTFESIKKIYATAKSSAIKEFGKFLIDKSVDGGISVSDIPEYVKEMVGDDSGS